MAPRLPPAPCVAAPAGLLRNLWFRYRKLILSTLLFQAGVIMWGFSTTVPSQL